MAEKKSTNGVMGILDKIGFRADTPTLSELIDHANLVKEGKTPKDNYIYIALCKSTHCAATSAGQHKANMGFSEVDCPQCGHALCWVRRLKT